MPRSWDAGRVGAPRRVPTLATCVLAALMMIASACGEPAWSAPPDPQFTRGEPPRPTSVPSLPPITAEEPELDDVVPDGASLIADDTGRVDLMFIRDDAGNTMPNVSGWAAFDAALGRRLAGNASSSVAVMVDGVVVHQVAFGERVALSGQPVTPDHRFRIGSISKTITAIVALQLVEQGVLTLDEPVGQLLIDHLAIASPDADVAGITVRELLSHTAGLPDHQGTFFGNGSASYVDAVRYGLSGNVGSGGGYNYANMGYAALTVLIEAVTGKTYERVVGEQLLEPLGIEGMRLTGTFELGPDEVSHHPLPGRSYMEALGGAGAWNATPTDVVTIFNSIDPTTGGWKALSPKTLATMRFRVPNGQPPGGYGLGLINYSGDAWGHTGTIEHAHSMVLVQPDGVTWAVSVSGDSPSNTESLRSIVRSALAGAFAG